MTEIDRKRVKNSFQRGALEYDRHTPVQMKVVEKLLQQLDPAELPEGARLLDVGCGTGRLLEQLVNRFPPLQLTGLDLAPGMLERARERLPDSVQLLQGDAEQLPFSDGSFDLVLSSSTFQWLNDLTGCFCEVKRVLAKGGLFRFCFFGEGTLKELGDEWQNALHLSGYGSQNRDSGLHDFHTVADVKKGLELAGFNDIQLQYTVETAWYPDLPALLKGIKRIGAGTSRPLAGRGLGWRGVLHKMAENYQKNYGTDQGVPASYGVIYGAGRR